MRTRAKLLVDELEPGQPVDFVETVAVPFPLYIISALLGMPDEDWRRFFEWSEAVIPGATDWSEDKRMELQADMHDTLLATTVARRADPRDDLISVLAEVEIEGRKLSDAELAMFLIQLLVAGNETTRNLISGGLAALAEHPARGSGCAATVRSYRRRSRRCSGGRRPSSASCGRRRATPSWAGRRSGPAIRC